jgi:hypothetical protein
LEFLSEKQNQQAPLLIGSVLLVPDKPSAFRRSQTCIFKTETA